MAEQKAHGRTRDAVAFGALLAFVAVVYVVPSEWVEALAPLRLALATSVVAAVLMLVRRLTKGEALSIDGLRGVALIGLAILSLASTEWSVNPEHSRFMSVELLKLVAIYLTLVNVVSTPGRLRMMCIAMVLFSVVPSIGVIRWFLSGSPLVEGFRSRWVGVYSDPNHMAMDIGLIVPIAVSFAAGRENRISLRMAMVVSAVLAVCAIILSHSRGGFLGLCAGLTVWMFIARRRWKAFLVAAAFAIGLAIFAPSSFWQRTESLTTFREDPSALGRVYAWKVASEINRDKPLLGVGVGGFRYAWPLYAPPEATHAYVAHNVYLDVLGDLGFVGLLLFLIFTGGVAGGVFRAARNPRISAVAAGIAAAVAGYLVCDLFSGYILSAHFYVLFGLAAAADRIAREERVPILELPRARVEPWAPSPSRALKA
jgi:O-antigen ligase